MMSVSLIVLILHMHFHDSPADDIQPSSSRKRDRLPRPHSHPMLPHQPHDLLVVDEAAGGAQLGSRAPIRASRLCGARPTPLDTAQDAAGHLLNTARVSPSAYPALSSISSEASRAIIERPQSPDDIGQFCFYLFC